MDASILRKVFHDIRNSLATIQGYAQFLQDEDTLTQSSRQYAEIISDRTSDLTRMIVGLSNISREFAAYSVPPVSFPKIFEKWKGASCFAKGIDFEEHIDPLTVLPLTPDRIKSLLNELGSNSQRFCPQPWKVICRTEGRSLLWQDHGPGVPNSYLNQIGEAFKSFANRFCPSPGLGIGLAHCRRLVEEAGGRIFFESNGTGFLVRIEF